MPPFESFLLLPLGILIGYLCCVITLSRYKEENASQDRTIQVLRATIERERRAFNESIASQNQLAMTLAQSINTKLAEVKTMLMPAPPKKRDLPFILVEEEETQPIIN